MQRKKSKFRISPYLVAGSLFVSGFSYANSDFVPNKTNPTGLNPEAVAVGDMDDDGRDDLVMTLSHLIDQGKSMPKPKLGNMPMMAYAGTGGAEWVWIPFVGWRRIS